MIIKDDYDSCMVKMMRSAEVETDSTRFNNDQEYKRLSHDYCFAAHMAWYEKGEKRKQELKEKFSAVKEYQGKAMLKPMPVEA